MSRHVVTLAAVSFSLVFASPAVVHAEDAVFGTQDATRIHVKITTDETSDAVKAKFAYARLQAAAHQACDSDFSDPASAAADKLCYEQAMGQAVAELNNPVILAMNSGASPTAQLAVATAPSTPSVAAADVTATPASAVASTDTSAIEPGSIKPDVKP